MTSQLTKAMAEYPDELRVVMEAQKYWPCDHGEWVHDGEDAHMNTRGIFAVCRNGHVEVVYYATDNDAIVACIEHLVNGGWQINLCEWTTAGLLIQALELVRQANECDKRFEEMING